MGKKEPPQRSKARERRRDASNLNELPLWPTTVQGGKYVRELERLIVELREENPHGNQSLFLDDVFVAHLLAFFNPSMRSLRKFEDFSQTQQAQRVLPNKRIPKSTLSDYHKFADADRLQPIIQHLRSAIGRRHGGSQLPSDLATLSKDILAVDGTFFTAAADVAWAVGCRTAYSEKKKYKARLDVDLNVDTWIPEFISVPEPKESEANAAIPLVKPDAIHLYDRGYNSFALVRAHYHKVEEELVPLAEFVMRVKSNRMLFEATEERSLSEEQQKLGIISDRVGYLSGSKNHPAPQVQLREVIIRSEGEKKDGGVIRLLTNMLEIQAETIGLLYQHRWQVELFLRWLKCYAQFDHLISHSKQGVELQFYVTIVGVLLMYLYTGGRPSTYALNLLNLVAQNAATLEEILPILRERARRAELDRQSAARRRAHKKAEGK